MEATGRDGGGRGPSLPWRYRLREQTGRSNSYDSSSSSGTIVSTTYSSSRGSRLSSISMDAVRQFELASLDEDTELVEPTKKSSKEMEERIKKHMYIKSLVQEFLGAPSAECSTNINSCDMSVLERWFSELDVDWVLHLPNGDDASAELHHTSAERWIRGLHRILETIPNTSVMFLGLPDVCEQEDQIHFVRFAKEAMSKMLSFVDFAIRQVVVCINEMPPAPYKELHTLLAVYKALPDAPYKFWWSFVYYYSEGVGRILQEMEKLLSAKREEIGEAIWSTIEPIRTTVLESIDREYGDNSSSSPIPQASSDIHKATLSLM